MNKPKLKFLTTLTLIGVIFAACEMNEDVISENHYSNDLKIKLYEKKYEQLMTEKKFINSFSKIPKKSSNSILNRTVMEDEYGFTISDKPAKVIEMNGDVSYTFLIERDSIDTNFFENLVIQTDSLDNTEAYIIKYNLNTDYYLTEHNTIDFSATKEIIPITYNNENSTTNKIIYQETCTVLNTIICCQAWSGGTSGYCHTAQLACLTSDAGTQYLSSSSETVCTTTEIDLGDTSGGGGSSGEGGGSGGGGSVNTSPVNNCRECIPDYAPTPCDELKNNSTDQDFIDAMDDLVSKSTSLNKEVGYTQAFEQTSNDFSYTYNDNTDTNTDLINWTITTGTDVRGIYHTHYNINTQLSVFSPDDLYMLYSLFGPISDANNNVTFTNNIHSSITFILISAHGTRLALKFDDSASINKFRLFCQQYFQDWNIDTSLIPDELNNTDRKKFMMKYDKYVKNRYDNEKQKTNFAKFLEKNNLGLSLYQPLDDTFANWEKINSNGSKTPCQ